MLWRNSSFAVVLAAIAGPAVAAPPPGYFMSLAVYRPSTNSIYAYADLTANPHVYALNGPYGQAGDIPVVGDFDGNGVYDLAVVRISGGNATWYADTNHDLTADPSPLVFGGLAGDIPLAADFDGDGISDLVIYRGGTWFIRKSTDSTTFTKSLGGAVGDVPVIGDFDGDGIPDIAIFHAGAWTIQMSSGGTATDNYGDGTYKPCAADWDHDGRADLCVFLNGVWKFKHLGTGGTFDQYTFGTAGDIPLAGGAFDTDALFVWAGASGTQNGSLANPYATISQARDHAVDGSVIRIARGTYTEYVNLYGPSINYAPGQFGKNNLKLFGVSRRAVNIAPSTGYGFRLWAASGYFLENFSITSPNNSGIILGSSDGSYTNPGSSATIEFNSIANTSNYGVLVTGQSQAVIHRNTITNSVNYSGIGLQGGPASNPAKATISDNEIASNGPINGASGGNGIEATQSSIVTAAGNYIHDNGRFGIIGTSDAQLTIGSNTITANVLNGIILCGGSVGASDKSTATISANTISGNGTAGGSGYNGVEFYRSCIGKQIVTGNVFDSNTLNGIYIGGGTLNASNNTFSNNQNGITIQSNNYATVNTIVGLFGNDFTNNTKDGVFAQLDPGTTAHDMVVTIGSTQGSLQNHFSGQGFHAIGCSATTKLLLNCPAGGNTFATSGDNIESTCSCDDIFHDGFGP